MKRKTLWRAGLLVLFAAAVLTSCYAPLRNQNASLNLSVKSIPSLPGNQTVLLLMDNSYQSSLAEILWLVSKGHTGGGLSSSEADRLTTLAKEVVTNGFVKFGGFPFLQLTLNGPSGTINIPGIPADWSYLVKIFVFNTGYSFNPKDIDQGFFKLVEYENIVFANSSGESYTVPFQNWTVPAAQIVTVTAGETASPITVSLTSSIP